MRTSNKLVHLSVSMVYTLDSAQCRNYGVSSQKEWLLANGIGGFAMGTASGANTRRYHGLLVAAVQPPEYRMVLLANLEIEVQSDANPIGLSANQYSGAVHPEGFQFLEQFSVSETAYWRFKAAGMVLEKRVAIHPGENAVTIGLKNAGLRPYRLIARPLVSHKFYHDNFRVFEHYPQIMAFPKGRTVMEHGGIPLELAHPGADRNPVAGWYYRFEHLREIDRGLDPRDDLFCPCELVYELAPGQEVKIAAASFHDPKPLEEWPVDCTTSLTSMSESLAHAASKFFVETPQRTSILAGYPWFTDWGRDTMISIPGLCLHTGRVKTARKIITDYISQMKKGLIPNRFVEYGQEPEYNTVDATLWLANALYKTLEAEWDAEFATTCFSALREVIDWHVKGTEFGIVVDQSDALLTQGAPGVQLTWMDAKVGDWVVTPRRGKAVEINGLWINALRVYAWLADKLGKDAKAEIKLAEQAEASFERKFWKETLGHYLDIVDPDDGSLRPNQLIAMALPFGPAKGEHAKSALGVISRELLTPVGMRTLGPEDASYHGIFKGSVPELDAAYHQGTVWPWLMGSYITALVKVTGDVAEARRILRNAKDMLTDCGLGGLAEVYDGDEPRSPGGCPFQAWSVAEWLRAWVEDVGGK